MLRFLDDSDLVEQEQDSIHRILSDEKSASVEFPFAAGPGLPSTQDAACSPTGLPAGSITPTSTASSSRRPSPPPRPPQASATRTHHHHVQKRQPRSPMSATYVQQHHYSQPQPFHTFPYSHGELNGTTVRFPQAAPGAAQFLPFQLPPGNLNPYHMPAYLPQPVLNAAHMGQAWPPSQLLLRGMYPTYSGPGQPFSAPPPSPQAAAFVVPNFFAQPPPAQLPQRHQMYRPQPTHFPPPPLPQSNGVLLPQMQAQAMYQGRFRHAPPVASVAPPPPAPVVPIAAPVPVEEPVDSEDQSHSGGSDSPIIITGAERQSDAAAPFLLSFGTTGLPPTPSPPPIESPTPSIPAETPAVAHPVSVAEVCETLAVTTVEAPLEEVELPSPCKAAESPSPVAETSPLPPMPPAPKTWASLLKSSSYEPLVVERSACASSSSESGGGRPRGLAATTSADFPSITPVGADAAIPDLRRGLAGLSLEHGSGAEVRGLANRGNWCYINAVLQALLACPPFFHLLQRLSALLPNPRPSPTTTPTLDALVGLIRQMGGPPGKGKGSRSAVDAVGMQVPWFLIVIANALDRILPALVSRLCPSEAAFKHGRQEDAQEFLLAVLNAAHEELIVAADAAPSTATDAGLDEPISGETTTATSDGGEADDEGDHAEEWQQVGPGRKAAVTRDVNFAHSLLSQIFVGQIRQQISELGAGKDAVNLEPFFTLSLEINSDSINSVESALVAHLQKETFKRTVSGTKQEVDATKVLYLGSLPPVLIVHLKYFLYCAEKGARKIFKPIAFQPDLTIATKMIPPKAFLAARAYKLAAVVFHHGEALAGGHYTADVWSGGRWVEMDDAEVRNVTPAHLEAEAGGPRRVPYLLFYRRADLIPPPPPPPPKPTANNSRARRS